MFEGIKLRTMFNKHEEVHAFLIGYFEVTCPWPAIRPICKESDKEIKGEYHYYVAGRAVGFVFLLFIVTGLFILFKEVIL